MRLPRHLGTLLAVALLGSLSTSVGVAEPSAHQAQPGPINAANTFGWFPAKWVYDWEFGESTDPWATYADGTGRTTSRWGMLVSDSGPSRAGSANHGSLVTTLTTGLKKYGRWEIRLRAPRQANGGSDYQVKAELVPASSAPATCSGNAIAFADFVGYDPKVKLWVRSGGKAWSYTEGGVVKNDVNFHTYAVEVTKKRVSFFVDHRVTASLKVKKAMAGQPLAARFSLLAPTPTTPMAHTRMGIDWIRYFTLAKKGKAAKLVKKAPKLKATSSVC